MRLVVRCFRMSIWPRLRGCLAASVLLGLSLSATPASAVTHCEGYNYEEFSSMSQADKVQWFTDELAQCENEGTQVAAYNNRGLAYYELGEFDRALEDYSQAIALDPDYAYAYFGRAYTYYELGRNDEAIADFDQALALDPTYTEGYSGRAAAECLKSEPRTQRALEDILALIQREPQWAIDWQAYLSEEGYYTGPISGDFDEASQAAFSAWCNS